MIGAFGDASTPKLRLMFDISGPHVHRFELSLHTAVNVDLLDPTCVDHKASMRRLMD